MFLRLCLLRGAVVISCDRSDWRLAEATRLGAHAVVNLEAQEDPAARVAAVLAATPHGRGADVGIEAVGLAEVWEQCVRTLRPGGTAILFGGPPKGTTFAVDTVDMHYKEYTLKGIFHHAPRYVQTAMNLLISGAVDGAALATEIRPLERLVESLEDMSQGKGSKYILVP